MQSIRDDIKREHHDIQSVDIITFFQVAQFVIAFQHQKVLLTEVRIKIWDQIYVHLEAAST